VLVSLEKDAQDACAEALRSYGFVPKRRGILLQPGPTKAASGWLGLNLATWGLPEVVQVNPVVGVRHVPLEVALTKLAGWPAPVACVSRPLGHLMPQKMFVQWDFTPDGVSRTAADLAQTVSEFGQPFIDFWSDWDTFAAEIGTSGLLTDNVQFIVLPIVSALRGDTEAANEKIALELRRIGDSGDVYALGYRDFAAKFAEYDFGGPVNSTATKTAVGNDEK
jgi:hypothetical protein